MCYASKYLKKIEDTIKDIKNTHKELSIKQSQLDKELSNKYHQLENKVFNAAEGYYIAKDLQVLLQKRRVVKQEQYRLDYLIKRLKVHDIGSALPDANRNLEYLRKDNGEYASNFENEVYEVLQ